MTPEHLEDSLDRRRKSRLNQIATRRIPLVYHYTNMKGLLGVVRNERAWATDSAFLNDPTELLLAHKLVIEELKLNAQALPVASKHAVDTLVDAIETEQREWAQLGPDRVRVYVFCCSSRGDSLSQWRGYADDGAGFAIGIRFRRIDDSPLAEGFGRLIFHRMEYDKKKQLNVVRTAVKDHVQAIGRLGDATDVEACLGKIYQSMLVFSAQAAMSFKHEGYAEEREFRMSLVATKKTPHNIVNLREDGRPYVSFPPGTKKAPLCSIEKVVIGPKNNEARARATIHELTYDGSFGEKLPEITMSQLAYR